MTRDPIGDFRAAVLAAIGYAPDSIEPGRLHRFPTCERAGDAAGFARLFDDLRGGVYGDHRRGISERWKAEPEPLDPADRGRRAREIAEGKRRREEARQRDYAAAAERIAHLWAASKPIEPGDPVDKYLRRRGLADAAPWPRCLRAHPALDYWNNGARLGTFTAMLAPIVHTGRRGIVSIHRTFLTADGSKASVPTPKKLTKAAGPISGGCIPLMQPNADGVLGVSEGIENAFAARIASGLPCIAAYSAGALAAFHWPDRARRLVIWADHDKAGIEAAAKLAERARTAGLRCDTMTPSREGFDWLDVLAASREAVA